MLVKPSRFKFNLLSFLLSLSAFNVEIKAAVLLQEKQQNSVFKNILRVSSHIGGIYAEGGCPPGTALSFRTRGPIFRLSEYQELPRHLFLALATSTNWKSYNWKLNLHPARVVLPNLQLLD